MPAVAVAPCIAALWTLTEVRVPPGHPDSAVVVAKFTFRLKSSTPSLALDRWLGRFYLHNSLVISLW